MMTTIKLPEFIFTEVAGRLLMIRTTSPHFIGEVVPYHNADEMHQAVGLLHTGDIPYITLTKHNKAIIFVGAMGRVPLAVDLQHQIIRCIMEMGDFYLKNNK